MTEQTPQDATPDDPTAALPPTTPSDLGAPPPAEPAAPAQEAPRGRHTRTILEIVGAAAAVVLIVAAGITGFAIGALVTGHDDRDGSRGSGDIAMAPQAPGDASGDRDGDRDGHRQGPPGFGPQQPGQPLPGQPLPGQPLPGQPEVTPQG